MNSLKSLVFLLLGSKTRVDFIIKKQDQLLSASLKEIKVENQNI